MIESNTPTPEQIRNFTEGVQRVAEVATDMAEGVRLGFILVRVQKTQEEWSQEVFGRDEDRGPRGALKHLQKEAEECLENPSDLVEYADCLLLIMDATRRAGFSLDELLNAAESKQVENELRDWETTSADEPVFHVKSFAESAEEALQKLEDLLLGDIKRSPADLDGMRRRLSGLQAVVEKMELQA